MLSPSALFGFLDQNYSYKLAAPYDAGFAPIHPAADRIQDRCECGNVTRSILYEYMNDNYKSLLYSFNLNEIQIYIKWVGIVDQFPSVQVHLTLIWWMLMQRFFMILQKAH